MQDQIQDGSHVFIFLDAKRNWIRKVTVGEEFHSNRGIIKYDDLIGRPYGIRVESHSGTVFQIHRPSPTDIQIAMGRNTQIVYPKDAGTILVEAGIGAGMRVVESGTGSGALTSILSRAVGPSGQVYTYEIREDMYNGAKKNLEKYGLTENITMYNQDILEGIKEEDVDAVVLDLATPWELTDEAHRVLKPSRYMQSSWNRWKVGYDKDSRGPAERDHGPREQDPTHNMDGRSHRVHHLRKNHGWRG
jgi:tRNA (adenine57-N1/adenine58-N1)-methyltransferase